MSKSSNDVVIVTFAKPWRGYSPTEVAGFSQETVDALIKGGVAVLHDGKAPASAAKSTVTKPPGKGAPSKPQGKAELPPATIPGSAETEPGSETDGGTGVTSGDDGPAGGGDGDGDDEEKP
jgi:hypothetical protein